MSDDLQDLIDDLGYAAGEGAHAIAAAITRTGTLQAELGLRAPGRVALAVAGLGGSAARLAGTGPLGVSQENAEVRQTTPLGPIATRMAEDAAADGVRLIVGR